ncbi:MAG TPA: ABC transporter substrate-binding protein [Clostridia bacterium]|nr:ABC transporter substrate-binding protein [Clostridia bacterium]
MKKILIITLLVLCLVTSVFLCTACNDYSKTIGIIQFGNHESLNNCYDGIIIGLEEAGINKDNGYTIDLQVSSFDSSISAAQAQSFANKNVGLVAAIATPSALAAAGAVKGDIPVVYCAVSDPISAGLTEMENVTGSSDLLDCEGQVQLIKSFIPTVDKIGIIYCTGEPNSTSQLASMEAEAAKENIEIVSVSIGAGNEIMTALNYLLATEGLDCISNLTDNTVVGCLDTILEEANKVNIPVFGSEIEQVKGGCLAGVSLDYVELGRLTGLMIAKIIGGETIVKGDYITVSDSEKVYNSEVAASFGLAVPTNIDLRQAN